jgi:hypothetical protein
MGICSCEIGNEKRGMSGYGSLSQNLPLRTEENHTNMNYDSLQPWQVFDN